MTIIEEKDRKGYPDYTIFVKCDKCSTNLGIFNEYSTKKEQNMLLEGKGWFKEGVKWYCPKCGIPLKRGRGRPKKVIL